MQLDYTQVLITIISLVLAPLVAALFEQMRLEYQARTTETQRQTIAEVVRSRVLAAEQLGRQGIIQDKKAAAIRTVQRYLNSHSIPLDRQRIEAEIERVVFAELQKPR